MMSQQHKGTSPQHAEISWKAFAERCQKPDHTRIGSWMARKIARPAALRVTWLIAPWGISAHAVTLSAWSTALAGVAALGWGTTGGWLLAAALLQTWYLLDHVDGQLARWHGAVSLDGAQLDYLMHHSVQLLLPCGVGWGLFVRSAEPAWLLVGGVWGVCRLLIGLFEDTQFKAFEQRWKRLIGTLELVGGGGGRPAPHQPPAASRWRQLGWLLRKSGEAHVVMNAITLWAAAMLAIGPRGWLPVQLYAAAMAVLSATFFCRDLLRGLADERAERSFAAWFRPAEGHALTYENGWWHTRPGQDGQVSETAG